MSIARWNTAAWFERSDLSVTGSRGDPQLGYTRLSAGLVLSGFAGLSFLVAALFHSTLVGPTIIAFALALVASLAGPIAQGQRVEFGAIGRLAARTAVVLLGIRISVPEVIELGRMALPLTLACLAASFVVTIWTGRWLRVDRDLTQLIAAGTAVCGASAILAVGNARGSDDEGAAYAVVAVTILGTLSMLIVMLGSVLLPLSVRAYGTWAGMSLHEVAQVLGAAQFVTGSEAVATLVKLARILALPAVVLASVRMAPPTARPKQRGVKLVPGFVWGFFALVAVQSMGLVPKELVATSGHIVNFLLAVALAGLAFGVKLDAIRKHGWRPVVLAMLGALFMGTVSLAGVLLLGA